MTDLLEKVYITKLEEYINKTMKRKKNLTYDEKQILWFSVDKALSESIENYNKEFCRLLFNGIFECSFKYDISKAPKCDIIETGSKVLTPNFGIPQEFKQRFDRFNYLIQLPQPEQKTFEWYKMREGMLTASTIAVIVGDDPYNTPSYLLEEKCKGGDFNDNISTYHGKKYEPIAQKFYSHLYNVELEEFGIIRSEKYNFIGASPDGIATCYTLDKQFSPLVGRMLEIKCPLSRKIATSGNIIKRGKTKALDGIVPVYYWCQMQLQMEVCDLDECDFFQCEIYEYDNRDEYLKDTTLSKEYYEEQGIQLQVKDTLKKGCIIELMPKCQILAPHLYEAKYLYPLSIDMTDVQYDEWILETTNRYNNFNMANADTGYYVSRVVYWKMAKTHKITIKRDRKWFQDSLPKLDKFWKDVQYYKNHLEELPKYLEDLRKDEPIIKKDDTFMISFGLPQMYKKFTRVMDLLKNPYDKTYIEGCVHCGIHKKQYKNLLTESDIVNDTSTISKNIQNKVIPIVAKKTNKSSVFMKAPIQNKKTYEQCDDFLSDSW